MALLQIKNTLVVSEDGKSLIYTDITGQDDILNSTKYGEGGSNNLNYRKIDNYITEYQITKPDKSIVSIIDNKSINSAVDTGLLQSGTLVIPTDTLTKTFSLSDLNIAEALLPVGVYTIKIINWFWVVGEEGTFLKTDDNQLSTVTNPTNLQHNKYDDCLIKLLWGSNVSPYQKYEDCLKQDTTASSIEWGGSSTVITLNENITIDETPYLVFLGFETELNILIDKPFLDCYQPKIARISVQPKSCCPSCKSADIDNLYDMWMGYIGVLAQFASAKYNDANSNIIALNKICSSNCNCGC